MLNPFSFRERVYFLGFNCWYKARDKKSGGVIFLFQKPFKLFGQLYFIRQI
jgi:hypothetical protein